MSSTYESGADSQTLKMVTQIVSSYVGAHALPSEALPGLIRDVYQSLVSLEAAPAEPASEPAVPLRRSVFADHLVCLECGISMKMLKRHLLTVHQMTPDDYRTKWTLTPDYPMVAPEYAKVRSDLAKQSGLGKKPDERSKPVRGSEAKTERKRRGE
jgi:predicted transcriptional regulator